MIFITGGYYQGKLSYAKESFGLSDEDIYVCDENSPIDFELKCIYKLEEYVMYCVKKGIDPLKEFARNKDIINDRIIICTDIFCGVVSDDPIIRKWRDMTGHLCGYLASQADTVIRIFLGIAQELRT